VNEVDDTYLEPKRFTGKYKLQTGFTGLKEEDKGQGLGLD
jgi:hypothetical protein